MAEINQNPPLPQERRVQDRRLTSQKSSERRTVSGLFINKPLIKRYVMLIVVIMLISSCLIGFVIHQTIKQSLEREAMRVQKISVYDVLMQVNNELLFRVFFILFLSVIATGVAGVLFLHRVAGPVYRIRNVLKTLASGKIPDYDVKLREGDFFAEVVKELNHLIARMRSAQK